MVRGRVLGLAATLSWVLPAGAQTPPADAAQCRAPTAPLTDAALVRDSRATRLRPRGRALLVTELEHEEMLLASLPEGSPERARSLRRLAEGYVELENAAAREAAQAGRDRDELAEGSTAELARQQAITDQATQAAEMARQRAQMKYTSLTNDYPNYDQRDAALYYLAYEYERASDLAQARRVYFTLIQSYPSSRYIPNAYLAYGELFFNEAFGDASRWALAQQAYQKAISYPPPANEVYGYAWFKLGHVAWHSGNPTEAAQSFQKARAWATSFPQSPSAALVKSAATAGLAALRASCPTALGP
jgi:TolA-binding protein